MCFFFLTASSTDMCEEVAEVYHKLLVHENSKISYSTKSALLKLVSRKTVKSEDDDSSLSRSSSPVSVASTSIHEQVSYIFDYKVFSA